MSTKIYCWGQLSETTNTSDPLEVKTIENFSGLVLTRTANYIWKDQTLYTWGNNFLKSPEYLYTTPSKISSISISASLPFLHTLTGTININSTATLSDDIKSIATTSSGTVYLATSGKVLSWNSQTVLLENIVSVIAECSDFVALSATGEVYRWAHIHTPKLVKLQEKIENISCGAEHSAFVSVTGNLFVMGSNSYGQISLGEVKHSQSPVFLQGILCRKVVCGGFHTLVLGKNENLYSCGLGNMGQLVTGKFSNVNFLSPCAIEENLGEILDVYSTEMTSFIRVLVKSDSGLSTFRPANLEPKNSFLAFIHRQIVADAERKYLAKVAKQEKHKSAKQLKELERENNIQKKLKLFENEIIPNWAELKSSKKVADLVRQGLPSKIRGTIWRLLIGNPYKLTMELLQASLQKARSLKVSISTGEELSVKDSSLRLISLDIVRTFNNLGYFSPESPLNNDLRELLEAASAYESEIGYIQGMSYVAGMLLLNLDLLPAFQVFIAIITSPLLISFYTIDQEGISIREQIFVGILKENLLDLSLHLEKEGMQPAIFLMEWFVTLYSKTLSQEVAVRVWDLYFYFGNIELFKAGVGIMKILNGQMMESDLAGIMENLTHISEKVTDPDELVMNMALVRVSDQYCKMINELS